MFDDPPARASSSGGAGVAGCGVSSHPLSRVCPRIPADAGERLRRLYLVTSYCPCKLCCGPSAKGITASGKRVRVGMCAADKSVPFGTVYDVPGYGRAVVEDRGGAIKGNHIDVYLPTHKAALAWGAKRLKINRVEKEDSSCPQP